MEITIYSTKQPATPKLTVSASLCCWAALTVSDANNHMPLASKSLTVWRLRTNATLTRNGGDDVGKGTPQKKTTQTKGNKKCSQNR